MLAQDPRFQLNPDRDHLLQHPRLQANLTPASSSLQLASVCRDLLLCISDLSPSYKEAPQDP